MKNAKQLEVLNLSPVKWPKSGFLFTFGDVCFSIAKDRAHRDKETYAISLSLSGVKFAMFLDRATLIHSSTPSCPRLRRVAGSSDIAVFGQSWWMVLKPSWSEPVIEPARVDLQEYRAGSRLVRLGYNVLLEKNLARFVKEVVRNLEVVDGLLQGHMGEGFITLNFGAFDFFYGFVFASHKAGKTVEECLVLLPDSGVPQHYPESFDVTKVARSDIQMLYDELAKLAN